MRTVWKTYIQRGWPDPQPLQPDDHGDGPYLQHGAEPPRTFRSAWSLDGRSGRSLSRGTDSCSWMPTTPRSSCAFSPMSGDERLIEAYKTAQDIHAITASQVFHIPLNEVTPLQRRNAKAVNFRDRVRDQCLWTQRGPEHLQKEAMEYIRRYFETYPQVKSFLDSLVAHAKEQGYVTTMFRTPPPGAGVKILELYAAFASANVWP